MFKILGDKTKTIFDTNLKNLINQIEYEKEINQLEAYEHNIKKNFLLIEEFVNSNIKFIPIVEVFSYFLSEEKIPDDISKEISKEKNLLYHLTKEILNDKEKLLLVLGNFETSFLDVRHKIKERLENKKLFEIFQNRILDVLRRRVNKIFSAGREFVSYEDNSIIHEFYAFYNSEKELKSQTDKILIFIRKLLKILDEEIDPLIESIMAKQQIVINLIKNLIEKMNLFESLEYQNISHEKTKYSLLNKKTQNDSLMKEEYDYNSKNPSNIYKNLFSEMSENSDSNPSKRRFLFGEELIHSNFSQINEKIQMNKKISQVDFQITNNNRIDFRGSNRKRELMNESTEDPYIKYFNYEGNWDAKENDYLTDKDKIITNNLHNLEVVKIEQNLTKNNSNKVGSFKNKNVYEFKPPTPHENYSNQTSPNNSILHTTTTSEENYLAKLSCNKNLKVKIPSKENKISTTDGSPYKSNPSIYEILEGNGKKFTKIIDETVVDNKQFIQLIKRRNNEDLINKDKNRAQNYLSSKELLDKIN